MRLIPIGPSPANVLALGLCAAALAVAGFPADAAPGKSEPPPGLFQNLLKCRGLPDGAQRLACYDEATGALDTANRTGAVVVVDRQQIQEAKRDVFGFNMPSFGKLFDRGGRTDAALEEVQLTVANAAHGPDGKWVLVMENGQVWRQIDTEILDKDPHKGSTVRIRHGAIGSYVMNVDGQPRFKAHRDQ